MKLQKRHIVLAALVLALSAAVYLNWQFSESENSLFTPTSKELGAATYVNADTTSTTDEVKGAAKDVTGEKDADEYFATATTEREQAQDKATDTAKEVLEAAESSDEAKEEAVEKCAEIAERILLQSNIESILKAKGFSQCICCLSEKGCSVAVKKSEMNDDAPLIIKDAVMKQIEIEFNDITIIEV